MIDLSETRVKIDEIDRKIISLFNERMKLADDVANYKIATGKPVYDAVREKEKLLVIEGFGEDDFSKTALRELFTQIMSISRKYQYRKISDVSKTSSSVTSYSSDNIGFFGGSGTYTERAMKDFFGNDTKAKSFDSFKKVCEAVGNGSIEYGVLPIENSTTGSISDIYDLLMEYEVHILGEAIEPIDHALLGLSSANLEDITEVYSHPQPLLQCSNFLTKYPDWNTFAYGSTSKSALKVKNDGKINQAAIASKANAELYGLKVLAENIANDTLNATRFIVIGKGGNYLENADKISISFEIPHKTGSLYSILSNFIYNNINMTNIESRPIPKRRWQYRVFGDFDGNLNDAGVINAITGLKAEADSFTLLGNYVGADKK